MRIIIILHTLNFFIHLMCINYRAVTYYYYLSRVGISFKLLQSYDVWILVLGCMFV